MKAKTYTIVFGALMVFTSLEIWLINLPISRSAIVKILLIIIFLKTYLISMYYMNIKNEWRATYILALPALALIFTLSIAILIG